MSNPIPRCVGCREIENCMKVDEEKILTGYYCGDWREAPEAVVAAREKILYKFGSAGARALINRPPQTDEAEE